MAESIRRRCTSVATRHVRVAVVLLGLILATITACLAQADAYSGGIGVVVTNSGNNSLSKFDSSGQFVSTLYNRGQGYEPYFSSPSGLAFDTLGNLYVTNSGNSSLSKFDSSGQFVSALSNRGQGYEPYFSSPSGIAARTIPEPSSYAMAIGGIAYGTYAIWRLRKRA